MKPLDDSEVKSLVLNGVDFDYPRLVATIAEQRDRIELTAGKVSELLESLENAENEKEELRMRITAQTANLSQLDLDVLNLTRQVREIRDRIEENSWKISQY